MSSDSRITAWRGPLTALAALGGLQLGIYLLLALLPPESQGPTLSMVLALTAFALYLPSLLAARGLTGRTALALAVGLGLAFRLALLPEPPYLSDDHFRYLWDGIVQLRGFNPYRYAPADPALADIAEAVRVQVNHPTVPTIYPPLAQLVFAAAALLPGGLLPLKLIWLACDLGIAALLYRLIPPQRRLTGWLIYWWSPLLVIEVAWNAHLDLLGVLPLVAALWLARRGPRAAAAAGIAVGAALAGAALVKYFAAALVPAAAREAGAKRVLLGFGLTAAALYLPYLSAGGGLFAGLGTYAARWRFNEGLFHTLVWITSSPYAARAVVGVALVWLVALSVRNRWTLERTAFWLTGSALMLTPTLHPWYLLWMVPLLALRPNRAWLYLSGSVFLAYYGLAAYRAEGVWPEPWPLKLLIYGPFFVLLTYDAWRGSWWRTALEVARKG